MNTIALQRPAFDKLRKPIIVAGLCFAWEFAVRFFHVNPLLFPTLSDVIAHLLAGLGIGGSGELWGYIWDTLSVLLEAYFISIILAVVFTGLAVGSRWAREGLSALTGIFQPLPSIALLPMAILWFGFSRDSLIFVVVMSMLWPIASSLTVGFATVSPTLVRVGQNYELGRIGLIRTVLLPSALPMMIAGLKVGWGFGWRTVVAAELVFGATGGGGGIGWFINNSRLFMNVADGFAGIVLVVIIGLLTESLFAALQRVTTHRWGTEIA